MKALAATAAVGLALAAGGCARDMPRTSLTKLDCPETADGLKRVSVAADGKSCGYVSTDGAEIALKLIPVVGGVEATLKSVEADLRSQLVATPNGAAPDATASPAPAPAGPKASADAAAVIAQAEADARGARHDTEPADGAEASWDVDGDGGRDHGSGDRARIDLPGVHIDARDEAANVRIGPLHIDAQGDGAVIRMQRDVRLRGEALRREKRGVRATLILAGTDAPGGYKFAGYEVGGPRKGPLVVAFVKGQAADHDDIYEGVKKLVRKNAGV